MFIPAFLKFKSYKPLRLEKGMIFLILGAEIKLLELTVLPKSEEKWIEDYGYPVEPFIVEPGDPSMSTEEVLALPEQIGWLNEEGYEELQSIDVTDMEIIINHFDGWLEIEIDERTDNPVISSNLVVLRMLRDDSQNYI